MAATDDQKLKARMILGLPLDDVATACDALTDAELTLLDDAIAQFDSLRFRAAVVNSDGVSVDPEAQRGLVREYVTALLNIASPYSGFVGTVIPDECNDDDYYDGSSFA